VSIPNPKFVGTKSARVGLILVMLVTAVVEWRWLFRVDILTAGDWGYFFSQSQQSLLYLPSIWDPTGLGQINVDASISIINLGWGLLGHITSFALSERILFMWPIVLLLSAGGFWFLYNQFNSSVAAVVGMLIFLLNTPYINLANGDLTLLAGMAFAPIVFVLFQRALERSSITYGIAAGAVAALLGFYEFRVFYILAWILFFYLIYYLGVIRRPHSIQEVFRPLLVSAYSFGVLLLLNAFWILGLAKLNQFVSNSVFSSGLFGSGFENTPEAIAMFSPWWTGAKLADFAVQPIPLIEWVVPILAVFGLYVNRRNQKVLFFGLLAILGIILTKQQAAPFPSLYFWLFNHLPGFNAFREASKFYTLIVISYAVLISGLIDWLWLHWRKGNAKTAIVYIAIAVTCCIFLGNGRPLISGSVQLLYVARHIPVDYEVTEKILNEQTQFSRTAWLPNTSRWSFYDLLHPDINTSTLITSTWAHIEDGLGLTDSHISEIENTVMFTQPFASSLYSAASVKYIIVPLRDTANDDDFFGEQNREFYIQTLDSLAWLKHLKSGSKQVQIYENPSYKPYISTLDNVTNLSSLQNVEQKYSFITRQLKSEFAFAPPASTEPAVELIDPFELPTRGTFSGTALSSNLTKDSSKAAYINTNQGSLSYQTVDDDLTFTLYRNVGLLADGDPIGPQINQTINIDRTALNPSGDFMLSQGTTLTPIDLTSSVVRNLGSPTTAPIVYSVQTGNLVNNPDFENGLWQPVVGDCNEYDSSPVIGQGLVTDPDEPTKVLQLMASRHTACSESNSTPVSAGEKIMLEFDYRSVQAKQIGYELVWDSKSSTAIQSYLPVTDSSWHTYRTLVTVPPGGTSLSLRLEAIPNDHNPIQGVDRYTNVRISSLTEVDSPALTTTPQYAKVLIPTGVKTLSVSDPSLSGKNLVPDPSFASGLWQKAVGDCNNYDDNGDISMTLDTKDHSVGNQSLELDAKRHIACTSPSLIPVQESHTYLLSFDYESPNSKTASYSVSFNDPNHTSVSNSGIIVPDKNWHTFNQTFTVPFGATEASLTASADAADPPTTTIINRYDNFRLVEIPNVAGQYYITSGGGQTLHAPSKITYTLVNPTKKLIHITGATTPFYLAMSEAYHPQWRLELANSKSQGGLASWIPWIHPDAVPSKDHFDLDDFLNGWYVDPAALCKSHPVGCTINVNGSYNIEMIAEFSPQRWFYVGLVISITTLLACLGYLSWIWRRKWPVAIQWTSRPLGWPWARLQLLTRTFGAVRPRVDGVRSLGESPFDSDNPDTGAEENDKPK
jgi:hypothetical protein